MTTDEFNTAERVAIALELEEEKKNYQQKICSTSTERGEKN